MGRKHWAGPPRRKRNSRAGRLGRREALPSADQGQARYEDYEFSHSTTYPYTLRAIHSAQHHEGDDQCHM